MAGKRIGSTAALSVLALALGACGGGGGAGGGLVSIPPPPPPPTTPTTMATPPFGLTSTQQFATYGVVEKSGPYRVDPLLPDAIKFSWSAEAKAYEITIPGFDPSQLHLTFPGNNPVAFHAIDGKGNRLPLGISVGGKTDPPQSYSGLGFYETVPAGATDPFIASIFVYGLPTLARDIPTSGVASYSASVQGFTTSGSGYGIIGDARLNFDFGAGTLSGYMRPRLFNDWDGVNKALGQYDFTQTVYAPGSTSFSGKFSVSNPQSDSAFHGRFTGPKASELIAGWRAPYLDPFDNAWKTMEGVWIGKSN